MSIRCDIRKLKHRSVVQSLVHGNQRTWPETRSVKGSSVLLFGLSFNLILSLASLGYTSYSLNRFDSRLTVVEQDLMATNSQHQLADGVIVKPTSTHSSLSGPQKKSNVAKRAVNDPSMCLKCSSACFNLNVHRSVSCSLLLGLQLNPGNSNYQGKLKLLGVIGLSRVFEQKDQKHLIKVVLCFYMFSCKISSNARA